MHKLDSMTTPTSKMKQAAKQGGRTARAVTSAGTHAIISTTKKTSKKISKKSAKKAPARRVAAKKVPSRVRPPSPIQIAARERARAVETDEGATVAHDTDVTRIAGAVAKHRSELMDRLAR